MAGARSILPHDPYISAVGFRNPDTHVLGTCHHIEHLMAPECKCKCRGDLRHLGLWLSLLTFVDPLSGSNGRLRYRLRPSLWKLLRRRKSPSGPWVQRTISSPKGLCPPVMRKSSRGCRSSFTLLRIMGQGLTHFCLLVQLGDSLWPMASYRNDE